MLPYVKAFNINNFIDPNLLRQKRRMSLMIQIHFIINFNSTGKSSFYQVHLSDISGFWLILNFINCCYFIFYTFYVIRLFFFSRSWRRKQLLSHLTDDIRISYKGRCHGHELGLHACEFWCFLRRGAFVDSPFTECSFMLGLVRGSLFNSLSTFNG